MAVGEAWTAFHSWFWSESFWLPPNVTWSHFENKHDGVYYPQITDIYFSMFVGIIIIGIRYIFESCISYPFGKYCGVNWQKGHPPPHIKPLEDFFQKEKVPTDKDIKGLVKQSDLTTRQVERWFRKRRNVDRPVLIVKFSEACWVFTFYLLANIYGFYVLWDKPWFSATKYCWIGYPALPVTNDVYWYYVIELGFYWSAFIKQFSDIKRKDFWEMFVHHVCTIMLMSFSWMNNFVRIGTLVIVIHDIVDYWMQAAKITKYIKKQKLCDFFFGVFVILWFVTRLVVFPYKVIASTMNEAHLILAFCNVYYFYNFLLLLLLFLHIVWFVLIMRVCIRAIQDGEVQKDVRSDSEETESEEDAVTKTNGSGEPMR